MLVPEVVAVEPLWWLVGWIDAEGRAWPTRPIVRMSDSEIVLLPPEAAAFSGKRNCSKSFRFLEAVREADDGDDTCCCPAEEREAEAVEEEAEEAEAKCFSTPLGVH